MATSMMLMCTTGAWLKRGSKEDISNNHPGGDLVLKISQALSEEQYAGYDRALKVLASFETLPSCNRQAWSQLISSCSDLDTLYDSSEPVQSSELAADDTQSVFATRLAICELSAVSTEVLPSTCAALLTSDGGESPEMNGKREHKTHPSFFSGPSLLSRHKACLADIFRDTRFWTSYSNSLQNARTICEVSKKHVEKDEALEFHRSMLDVAKRGEEIHSHTVNNMHKLSEEVIDLLDLLRTAARTQATQTAQIAIELKTAFEPVLTQIFDADNSLRANLQLLQSVSQQSAANSRQQELAHLNTMRNHAEYERAMRAYATLINEFFTALEQKTGTLSERVGGLDSSLQKLLPQIAVGLSKWNLTTTAMDANHLKSKEVHNLMIQASERLQMFMLNQEEAHNRTMTSFSDLQSQIDNGIFSTASLFSLTTWVIRISWAWFNHLPTFAVALGYFLFFMSVVMMFTIVARKLATLPFGAVASSVRAVLALASGTPWPVSLACFVLSVYLGIVEGPADLVARWMQYDFHRSDFWLVSGTIIPMLSLALVHTLDWVGSAARNSSSSGEKANSEELI